MILGVVEVAVGGGGVLEDEVVGLGLIGEKEGEAGAQINVVMMSMQISSWLGEGPGGEIEFEEEEGWWERISSMRCERTCFAPRMRSVSRSWRWV